jgi:hypothetical protein
VFLAQKVTKEKKNLSLFFQAKSILSSAISNFSWLLPSKLPPRDEAPKGSDQAALRGNESRMQTAILKT